MKEEVCIISAILGILFITGCSNYNSDNHQEEYTELSKCISDQDCILALKSAGHDLDSPGLCTTKQVTERFDNWFLEENPGTLNFFKCSCDLSTNSCSKERK